jgi:ERCC4-related helicase
LENDIDQAARDEGKLRGDNPVPTAVALRHFTPPMELLRFALLRDGPRLAGGGRYVGMATAPVTPWPHQAVIARRVIDTYPFSFLLCDEVGLGKTIEAGLIIRSLHWSGLARRILISPPAGLTRQWQREMADKFLLPFRRALPGAIPRHVTLHPSERDEHAASLYEPALVIVSHGLLARRERRDELSAAPEFDLALLDEAHCARRRNPTQGSSGHPDYGLMFRTLNEVLRPKTKSLLLATATPMQLDPVEVSDLIRLTLRTGTFLFDPTLTRLYYEILTQFLQTSRLSSGQWKLLQQTVSSLRQHDPPYWTHVNQCVIDGTSRLAVKAWLERGRLPSPGQHDAIKRLLFAVSPLARVMLRHTRSLLEIYREEGKLGSNLAKRVLLPLVPIHLTPQEQASHQHLEDYCRGLSRLLARHFADFAPGAWGMGFYLSFLRLRFASSLHAFRETLRRRLERVRTTLARFRPQETTDGEEMDLDELLEEGDDDAQAVTALLKHRLEEDLAWEESQLLEMLQHLEGIPDPPSKMLELLNVVATRRSQSTGQVRQTVVFTRFYDTLQDIVGHLERLLPRPRVAAYSGHGGELLHPVTGEWSNVEREEIKQRFLRREIDILVCTDAAAEGLNLQSADFLINFDLPWNPAKLEQRIGRIDRIGQENPIIHVLNLCHLNSAEEIVYGRLLKRLNDIGVIVGNQPLSLLPVNREEFQALAAGQLTPQELERMALKRVHAAQQRSAAMEMPARELYNMYQRLEAGAPARSTAVNLDDIWETLSTSITLRQLGARLCPPAEARVMSFTGLPGVADGTLATASRETFEKGFPQTSVHLHFLSYGDPVFAASLEALASVPFPPGMRRITAQVEGVPSERVGYAVTVRQPDGTTDWRLVTSMEETRGMEFKLAASVPVPPAVLAKLEAELQRRASKESRGLLEARKTESINLSAARSQELLNLVTSWALIRERQSIRKAAPRFWDEANAILASYGNRQKLLIRGIPHAYRRQLRGAAFAVFFPGNGADGHVEAPRELLLCALEAACRVANSMRVRRSELKTGEVMGRMQKMMEDLAGKAPEELPP